MSADASPSKKVGSSIPYPPMVAFINPLSGGRKGEEVLQTLLNHGIAAFDLMQCSLDGTYFEEMVAHITNMYKGIMKLEEEWDGNDEFQLHPRILIAGGDGSIAWALATMDRALVSDEMVDLFLQRAQNLKLDARIFLKVVENESDHENALDTSLDPNMNSISPSPDAVNVDDSEQKEQAIPIPNISIQPNGKNRVYASSDSESVEEDEEQRRKSIKKVIDQLDKQLSDLNEENECDSDLDENQDLAKRQVTDSEIRSMKSRMTADAVISNEMSKEDLSILHAIYETPIAPAMALVPLGTGNDCSRCLGSGNAYPGCKKLINKLVSTYQKASYGITTFDRWNILFYDESHKLKRRQLSGIVCYFSFGFEAEISYNYAMARQENPQQFDTRWKNKWQWTLKGAGGAFGSRKLNDIVDVFVDGEKIKLPSKTRSIVLCNIQSISDGMIFWGTGPPIKKDIKNTVKPSLGDGKIELMCGKGITQWLQNKLGISHYRRMAQTANVRIVTKVDLPVMADGEAWMETPGQIDVSLNHQLFAVMGNKATRGVMIV